MTVHVWFMGHDLKSHERTIPDRKIAEAGTYDDRATFEDLVHRYLREVGDSVACIMDIVYEDD